MWSCRFSTLKRKGYYILTTNISFNNNLKLCFKDDEVINLTVYFAQQITQYCKERRQRAFDPTDSREYFHIKLARNVITLYRYYIEGKVVLNSDEVSVLKECMTYAIHRFGVGEFDGLLPNNISPDVDDRITMYAKVITTALKSKGFIVHRRNSLSSMSKYLMVDNGVLKLIRISEHKRVDKQYKYNVIILPDSKEDLGVLRDNNTGFTTYYITSSNSESVIDALVNDIIKDRELKRKEFGDSQYHRMVYSRRLGLSDRSYILV